MNLGILIARLLIGLALASHGAQKLFGWFGGEGPDGTARRFAGLGFRPGPLYATLAGLGEFGGGLLLATGLMGALGPAVLVLVMIVAIGAVHWKQGFYIQEGGYELCLAYMAGAVALAFARNGVYSLDSALGISVFNSGRITWLLMGLAMLGAAIILGARSRVVAPAAEQPLATLPSMPRDRTVIHSRAGEGTA